MRPKELFEVPVFAVSFTFFDVERQRESVEYVHVRVDSIVVLHIDVQSFLVVKMLIELKPIVHPLGILLQNRDKDPHLRLDFIRGKIFFFHVEYFVEGFADMGEVILIDSVY